MRLAVFIFMALCLIAPRVAAAEMQKAVFAGGCFWCMEAEFEQQPGVSAALSGYTGGHVENPTYEQVSRGETGHVEAIEVAYDPAVVSYEKLLEIFWDNVDPTDEKGQFCDKGSQYLAGIFYLTPEQQMAAEKSLQDEEARYGHSLAAFVRPAAPFYVAEEYHQDYYKKNSLRYKMYKTGCGRDARLDALKNQ